MKSYEGCNRTEDNKVVSYTYQHTGTGIYLWTGVPVPSVRETRSWLQKNKVPGLILADIQLSDGISIDMLAQLRVESPVIFITAFNQYAIRAFKMNSIDYILKPIDTNELETAFKNSKRNNRDYPP